MASLSPQLLAQVLQYLCEIERLGICARVCKAWRVAAIMASSSISLLVARQRTCNSFAEWLQAHGKAAAVNSLTVANRCVAAEPLHKQLQLPFQQLGTMQHMQLVWVDVTAGHGEGNSLGSLVATELPALT